MDQSELEQHWRLWAAKNIGGSAARVEAATQAAMMALSQRKSRDEAVATARQVASSWKEPQARAVRTAVDPSVLKQQWRLWVEEHIGGPEERAEAALDAVTAALTQGKSQEEIAATARQAAAAWGRYAREQRTAEVEYSVVLKEWNANRLRVTGLSLKEAAALGANKIRVMAAIRDVTGLGLKEAAALAEGAPNTVKEHVSKEEAQTIKKKFAEAGATVEIVAAARQGGAAGNLDRDVPRHPRPANGVIPARNAEERWDSSQAPNQIRLKWRDWVVQNFGGPEARVEIATEAALSALAQGKSPHQAAAAARQAAISWIEPQACVVQTTPDLAKGLIRGRVAAFQQRQEVQTIFYLARTGQKPYNLVWDFRLERSAPDGAPQVPVAVEMRSHGKGILGFTTKGFKGSVLNGDQVVVDARHYTAGKILRVEHVWNLTSNSIVGVRGSSPSQIIAAAAAVNREKYKVIRGRVTATSQRQDRPGHWNSPTVWALRIQRIGPDGNPLPSVEVEMRASAFEGSIAVGDELELDASGYVVGDVVGVKKVRNLSSNSLVRVR